MIAAGVLESAREEQTIYLLVSFAIDVGRVG